MLNKKTRLKMGGPNQIVWPLNQGQKDLVSFMTGSEIFGNSLSIT